jgi:hypothetical protein
MQTRYATIVSRHGCRKGRKTVCSQLRDWGALIPFLATSQFLQNYPDGGGSMTEGGVIQGEGSVLAHRGFIAFAPNDANTTGRQLPAPVIPASGRFPALPYPPLR